MHKLFYSLLFPSLLLSGTCAAATQPVPEKVAQLAKEKKCLFPKSRKRAPAWVCGAQADDMTITAVGSSAKSKAGISFMEQMAVADARQKLAQKLQSSVRKQVAQSSVTSTNNPARANDAAIVKITNEQLQGSKILKKIYAPNGTLYVLIYLDQAEAEKLREPVGADYLKQAQ